MRVQEALRLGGPIGQREGGRHPERVKRVDIAPRRQDRGRADQVAPRHRRDEPGRQRTEKALHLIVGHQVTGGVLAGVLGQQGQKFGQRGRVGRLAQHMQAIGDQGAFGFQQLQPQRVGVAGQVQSFGLFADQKLHLAAFDRVRGQAAQAGEGVLEVDKPLVQPRPRQGRRPVRDGDRVRPALGQGRFGRVVGGIKVDVRQVADQPVGPAVARKARLLARHELQRAMHSEVQDGIGGEILT